MILEHFKILKNLMILRFIIFKFKIYLFESITRLYRHLPLVIDIYPDKTVQKEKTLLLIIED
jgi:hypothetical protein